MTGTHDLPPASLACHTVQGHQVVVTVGGETFCEQHERHTFLTIGVRDSDTDDQTVGRDDFREVIDVDLPDAIRLARTLLDYATDMLDHHHDDDDDEEPT